MDKLKVTRTSKDKIIFTLDSKDWAELESLLNSEVFFVDSSQGSTGPIRSYWSAMMRHLICDTEFAPYIDNEIRSIPVPRL